MSDESETKESPAKDFPGWTKIQLGSSRKYRSPGGLVVSPARYMQLVQKYKGQKYVPESEIQASPVGRPKESFFGALPSNKSDQIKAENPTKIKSDQDAPVVSLPEPKPHYTKPKAGRATAKEITDGLYISLSIATSVIAFLLKMPELQMTEQEAKNIATPAANLLEPTQLNEKFGRMIADSGDWQLLGYALWLYFSRVTDAVKERADHAKSQRTPLAASGPNVPGASGVSGSSIPYQGSPNGNGRVGAALPYSGKGVGWPPQTP